ncbi:hypothetical protein GPL15_23200 [Clostridium sp. MCC353]|uniref:hypothetical protein n=1 Tax=Clostridium sp. MCC353 TaxID=2592646 RepID=UPI001C012B4E|nr:hypothetical protein [Clostridium sp. MCC353]MBT9779390.1 hypothetical protein [Clostridium sp. MCC353]
MKAALKQQIQECINKWTEEDIYAISFYIYYAADNPTHPVLKIGYNTESNCKKQLEEPTAWGPASSIEAKWNYAFWLHNEELVFGYDGETKRIVEAWLDGLGYRRLQDSELWGEHSFDEDVLSLYEDDFGKVTCAFIRTVAEVAKGFQEAGFLKDVFHKEIPIIIHDLEYSEFQECSIKVLDLNMEVNGSILPVDFIRFCNGEV